MGIVSKLHALAELASLSLFVGAILLICRLIT